MESSFTQGRIFDGKYELLDELGRGGLGIVFRARQIDVERIVALKLIRDARSGDEEFLKRFIREAQVLNQLSHANIVNVYSVGLSESGTAYMVMELVEGESVSQTLNLIGKMQTARALRIIRDAALALHYVHSHGVIHRDLKTANIILTDRPTRDTVKIIDFGLAKIETSKAAALTATGELMGTPEFMSPEQCMGRPASNRSDIYSLGICLFEVLTGGPPFRADDAAIGVIYKHLNDPVPKIRPEQVERFHPMLNEILEQALAKRPEDRYASMEEFAAHLDEVYRKIEKGEYELAKSKSNTPKIALSILSGTLALAIVIAGTSYYQYLQRDRVVELLRLAPAESTEPLVAELESKVAAQNPEAAMKIFNKVIKSDAYAEWKPEERFDFQWRCISAVKSKAPKLAASISVILLRAYVDEFRDAFTRRAPIDPRFAKRADDLCKLMTTLPLTTNNWDKVYSAVFERMDINGSDDEIIVRAINPISVETLALRSMAIEKRHGAHSSGQAQEALMNTGLRLKATGNYKEAEAIAKEALKKPGENSVAMRLHMILAACYREKGERNKMKDELALAQQCLSDHPEEQWFYFGEMYKLAYADGDWQGAANYIQKALKADARSASDQRTMYEDLARCYFKMGKPTLANEALKKAKTAQNQYVRL